LEFSSSTTVSPEETALPRTNQSSLEHKHKESAPEAHGSESFSCQKRECNKQVTNHNVSFSSSSDEKMSPAEKTLGSNKCQQQKADYSVIQLVVSVLAKAVKKYPFKFGNGQDISSIDKIIEACFSYAKKEESWRASFWRNRTIGDKAKAEMTKGKKEKKGAINRPLDLYRSFLINKLELVHQAIAKAIWDEAFQTTTLHKVTTSQFLNDLDCMMSNIEMFSEKNFIIQNQIKTLFY
jgi:hypothetical protein